MSKMIGQTEKFGVETDGTRVNFIPRSLDDTIGPDEDKIERHSYSSESEAKKAAKRYIEKNDGKMFDL